jgi:hypothetical protein
MRRSVPRFITVTVAVTAVAVGMTTAASAASTWAVQSVPFPSTAFFSAEMAGVSCTFATSCEAVMNTDTAEPAAARWNGTSWKDQIFPAAAEDEEVHGVSCADSTTCLAVGETFEGTSLADIWNGSVWQAMAPPPGDALNGISCLSALFCVAVGTNGVSGTAEPFAAKWNGTAWKSMTVPEPTGTTLGGSLLSVSCTAITKCVAVGESAYGTAGSTMAYTLSGATWTQQTLAAPPPGAVGTQLTGVSCSSATNCMAVGDADGDGDGGNTLFAEQWNGSTWTQQGPLPLPAGTTYSLLGGVSCQASRCTAVGYSFPAKGATIKNRHALAEYFNGTGWAVQATALPNAHQSLAAVSCVAIRTCTAVGFSITQTPRRNELPLAEQD